MLQRIALCLFFFSMNFEVWDPFHTGGFFSIARLTGLIYVLVSFPFIIGFKTSHESRKVLMTLLMFFGFLVLVNAFHAESMNDKMIDFTIFQNLVLFWILINHEQRDPLILERGMLFFALGSALLAGLSARGIGVTLDEGRVSVFGDNQNIIGQRMCISIFVLTTLTLQNRLRLTSFRYLFLLLLPLMFGLLVATGSRLAMLTFAIAFVAGIVLLKTRNYYFRIMALLAGIALFFFIWQLAMDNEVLRSRLLLSLHEGQLSDRDVIWKNILPIIRENPFFGVGQTGYAAFCMKEFGRYVSPHSVVMELAVFSGFTGLILYFIFLYRVFRMAYLSYKVHGFLLPVLLCLIVTGLLLGSHMLELKLGWAILAYVTCSAAYYPKTDRMAEVCYH